MTALLTPSIELQTTAALNNAKSTIGLQVDQPTWQSRVVSKLGHMGVCTLTTVGVGGLAYMIYGIVFSVPVAAAVGGVSSVVGFSTAGCMWYYIPTKTLEENAELLSKKVDSFTQEVGTLKTQITELTEANTSAKEQLLQLGNNLSTKTGELESIVKQLEATKDALTKLQTLQEKYQATTQQVVNTTNELTKAIPELASKVNQVAVVILEEEKKQNHLDDDVKTITSENAKMDKFLQNSTQFHTQLDQIAGMIKELLPGIQSLHQERMQLATTLDHFKSENVTLKSLIAQFKADQEIAQKTSNDLHTTLQKWTEIQNLRSANEALKAKQNESHQ